MARTTIPAELVAVNAIQGTLIADNAITAVHIATNAISGTLVADNAITSTHIAENNVTATQIAQNTITVTQIADSAVETAKINNGAVTQAKIADDAIGPNQLADNAVVSASIANGTIVEADMADNAVTLAKMASLARGSIIVGDAAGDPAALAIGSNTYVLSSDGTDIAWAAAAGTTINNNANNRIITGSGTANTLEGEANLTFDDTTSSLKIENYASMSRLESSAAAVFGHNVQGSTNNDELIQSNTGYYGSFIKMYYNTGMSFHTISSAGTAGDVIFSPTVNTTERMRIDSSGKVGIGTPNVPLGFAKLAIKGTNESGAEGPHVQYTTDTDDHPVLQQLNYAHNNISLNFDSYYDGDWTSSYSGSNFQIYKTSNQLEFNYDTGIGAGSTLSWNKGIVLKVNGHVDFPTGVVHAKAGFGTYPITSCSGFTGTAGQSYLILPPGGLEPVWAVYSGDNYKSRGKGYFRWWYGYGNGASAPNTNRVEVDFINKGFKYYEALIEDMSGTTTYSNSAPTWDYAYWSTQQTFNTTGNNTTYATSSGVGNGTVKAMWGNGGGHGLYDTTMSSVCSWGALDGNAAIGAGYDGSCGTYTSESRGAPSTFMYGSNLRLGRPISGSANFLQPNVAFSYWFNF